MAKRYTVKATTIDPATGKPLAIPSVLVLKNHAVKMAKMCGTNLEDMKTRARYIAAALEAYDA